MGLGGPYQKDWWHQGATAQAPLLRVKQQSHPPDPDTSRYDLKLFVSGQLQAHKELFHKTARLCPWKCQGLKDKGWGTLLGESRLKRRGPGMWAWSWIGFWDEITSSKATAGQLS